MESIVELQTNLNYIWVLVSAALVFIMPAGLQGVLYHPGATCLPAHGG